jgi:hypothetical protein
MTDIPFRIFGPQPLNNVNGETMYTAPGGTSKFFLRDISLTLTGTTTIHVKMAIGDITNQAKRVVDNDVTTANSPLFIRPLWLMDAGETLQGIEVNTTTTVNATTAGVLVSGTDGTAFATAAWTPAANTMYFLVQTNGVASGTTALNPSSITGNGTWTLINQTTSTVASAKNVGVSAWWWNPTVAGSNATTTVNFASTQHSCAIAIMSVTNIYPGTTSTPPWTSTATPVVQSVVGADTTAPANGNVYFPVTLNTLQTGYVMFFSARAGASGTGTPITGFTEIDDRGNLDASGSICETQQIADIVATPPLLSPILGTGGTWNTSTTGARASIAWELVPIGFVNCMVSGIEVH